MTDPVVNSLSAFANAVAEGDELEMPRMQAYANGLRRHPDDSALLSRAIELLDEMANRRLVRIRMLARLREDGLLDDTQTLAIADLADDHEPGTDHAPETTPTPNRTGRRT